MGFLCGSTLQDGPQRCFRPDTRQRCWVITGWDVPREFHVSFEVCGHVTALPLDIVHNVSLVHHVPLAIGNDLFEVVREEFSANIDSKRAFKNEISRDRGGMGSPLHSVPHDRSRNEGNDVGKAEAGVYD